MTTKAVYLAGSGPRRSPHCFRKPFRMARWWCIIRRSELRVTRHCFLYILLCDSVCFLYPLECRCRETKPFTSCERASSANLFHRIPITIPVCVTVLQHALTHALCRCMPPLPILLFIHSTIIASYHHVLIPYISYFLLAIAEASVPGGGSTTDARTLINNLATEPCMIFFSPPHWFVILGKCLSLYKDPWFRS